MEYNALLFSAHEPVPLFRSLISNTLVSAFAFLISAVVPLLLVPVLIAQYGIVEYGLIVLARILLPIGTFAIFDFGNSEIATQSVAQARHDGDWLCAGRKLRSLATYTLITGVSVATALALTAPWLTTLLNVPTQSRFGFELLIWCTAAAFPLLLTAMAADGVLKGFEAFRRLRSVDVGNAAAFGVIAFSVAYARLPFQWIGLAFIFTLSTRAIVVLALALAQLKARGARLAPPTAADRAQVRSRGYVMAGNRLLSASQSLAAPVVIGAFLGPSAVGLFDIITRIPRFVKAVTGLMSAAVLPLSARLDASNDHAGMRRLGEFGLLGAAAVTAPICAWGAIFSEPLLRIWIDETYAIHWGWQAFLFLVPLANVMTGFGGGALLSRTHVVARLNLIAFAQIVLQYVLALAFMHLYGERAFILGQVIAVIATFPLQMRVIKQEKQLRWAEYSRIVALVVVFGALVALGLSVHAGDWLDSLFDLALSVAVWMTLAGLGCWFLLLRSTERAALLSLLPFGKK